MNFIWERADWPDFTWNPDQLLLPLGEARRKQGRLLGSMAGLGFDLRLRARVEALTEEVVKSSEIEGEALDRADVRSSIAHHLGVSDAGIAPADRKIEGVVAMTLDATGNFAAPLTADRLAGWHAALFPTGYSSITKIKIGGWREDQTGPMRAVSGAIGRERIHFVAPPAARVADEMTRFLRWFELRDGVDGLMRAALAHLWFVTIHPFDDGNGRIARAVADMALAQDEGVEQRFYSMSAQIRRERAAYYQALESAQRGPVDITPWLVWFLGCYGRAIDASEASLDTVLRKAEFWRRNAQEIFSRRQRDILTRFLDGLGGNLTARKWAVLGKCSVDTAQRDINDLVGRGILSRNPGGSKNTSYSIMLPAG